MSCCCNQSASPFEIPLPLGTAPSWPITLSDDSTTPATALDLTGAALWFAAKAAPTDPDSAAVIFASTATGEITLTAPASGQAQIDLTAAQTAESATLLPGRTYYAYVKVELATGEIRTRSGWLVTTAAGIEAPSAQPAMLVEFLKTVWPRLRIGGRAPIPRSSFLQARNGTPLAARNSEVLLTR